MSTNVIIDVLSINQRLYLLFSEQEIESVSTVWSHEDPALLELSKNTIFKNRTKWVDLQPIHFKFMIMNIINIILDSNNKITENHDSTHRLNFLLCGYIKSLEIYTQSTVETIKIQRVDEKNYSFDFQGSLFLSSQPSKKNPNKLKIVVDNTNTEKNNG